VIQRASKTDIDVLAAIHATAFSAADAWSRDVFDLQLAMPNVFGLIHRAGGLILMRQAADEADVLTLAVAPAARRSGVAQALLLEATRIAASRGVRAAFLEVSVTNIAARELYTKTGFTRVGLRRLYYSDRSDALVLRLDLSPPE
jgi:[ribosomal protein S18]-alanine N-acetyltransferase